MLNFESNKTDLYRDYYNVDQEAFGYDQQSDMSCDGF